MEYFNLRNWKTFRKVTAILGIIQSTAWLILAVLCIILYYWRPEFINTFRKNLITPLTTYREFLSFCLYDTFLESGYGTDNRTLGPQNFHIFVWIYSFLSALWLIFSSLETYELFKRGFKKYEAHILLSLGTITIISCVLDAVLFSLTFDQFWNVDLFGDFGGAEENITYAYVDTEFKYYIGTQQASAVVMLIALRGIALWVFNCVAGALSIYIAIKVFQSPPILIYDNSSIPRPKIRIDSTSSERFSFSSDNQTLYIDSNSFTHLSARNRKYDNTF